MFSTIIFGLFIILEIMRWGRNRIINKLLFAEAVSTQSAKSFEDIGNKDMFSAKVLLISGIVKRVGVNQYYVDISRKYQIEKYRLFYIYVLIAIAVVFLIGTWGYVIIR